MTSAIGRPVPGGAQDSSTYSLNPPLEPFTPPPTLSLSIVHKSNMASRIGRRMFSPAFRAASRPRAPAPMRRLAACRGMSSSGAHSSSNSDKAWMIVSGLVFIPTIIYLLSPSARSTPHKAHAASGHGTPHTPSETVISKEEEPAPEPVPEPEPAATPESSSGEVVTDDEGTAVPAEEVKESIARAASDDSPKEAAQAEATSSPSSTPYSEGKPGQTSDSESEFEQAEKRSKEPQTGTVQSEDARGPTDLGEAREKSMQVRTSYIDNGDCDVSASKETDRDGNIQGNQPKQATDKE
ncbi:hypothetical protein EW146_g4692 [Bondarzewia mesenterica]|uniref:Uncharacterized protein n=1 Tax=Bondarzewia mesenterica TaxID=1095465 RepID=A0A4S4LZH0_9AGAM|nr:hypothetical protein EW146_g4692 [Bondarzewia mesenterica]